MTTILDYGAGNLQSVKNTLDAIGTKYEQVRDAESLRRASKIILPGVGHFGQTMRALDQLGVREALIERIRAGVPFMGICLGLQALFEASEEAPDVRGLGIFKGTVRRFVGDARIPHMGWDQVERVPSEGRLVGYLEHDPFVYFAHSYYCPVIPATTGICNYLVPFSAVVEQDNICGVQFHPEKSGAMGQRIVRNFVEC